MRIRIVFAWYDFWVGIYWDRKHRRLYILPVPCLGLVVQFRQTAIQRDVGDPCICCGSGNRREAIYCLDCQTLEHVWVHRSGEAFEVGRKVTPIPEDNLRETLEAHGCEHGPDHKETPPMMYPEWIACVVAKAKSEQAATIAGLREALADLLESVNLCCGLDASWVDVFTEKAEAARAALERTDA